MVQWLLWFLRTRNSVMCTGCRAVAHIGGNRARRKDNKRKEYAEHCMSGLTDNTLSGEHNLHARQQCCAMTTKNVDDQSLVHVYVRTVPSVRYRTQHRVVNGVLYVGTVSY